MATAPPLLSIEEYLHTSYKPDVHYVDGEIEERNGGEYDHSKIQTLIAFVFTLHEDEWGADAVVEKRIRISSSRVRICDVAILRADAPHEEVTATPPLLCIEILSPKDRLTSRRARPSRLLRHGRPQHLAHRPHFAAPPTPTAPPACKKPTSPTSPSPEPPSAST